LQTQVLRTAIVSGRVYQIEIVILVLAGVAESEIKCPTPTPTPTAQIFSSQTPDSGLSKISDPWLRFLNITWMKFGCQQWQRSELKLF